MYEFDKELLDKIGLVLRENGWDFGLDEETGRIFIFESLYGCGLPCACFMIRVRERGYSVYGLLPFRPEKDDEETITAVRQYLDRVNARIEEKGGQGAFEMLFSRAIRVGNTVDCTSGVPAGQAVLDSINCVIDDVQDWSDGLIAICYRHETDVDAVFDRYYPNTPEEEPQLPAD